MTAKCIEIEHHPGLRVTFITRGRSPGYRSDIEPSDLELLVELPDGGKAMISIKHFFKDYLERKGRKNFSPKVIKAIRAAMPETITIFETGFSDMPFGVEKEDLKKWAENINL